MEALSISITPEPSSPDAYPPPTINFWLEPYPGDGCVNCAVGMFNITSEGQTERISGGPGSFHNDRDHQQDACCGITIGVHNTDGTIYAKRIKLLEYNQCVLARNTNWRQSTS